MRRFIVYACSYCSAHSLVPVLEHEVRHCPGERREIERLEVAEVIDLSRDPGELDVPLL